jgi:hypothetical protein
MDQGHDCKIYTVKLLQERMGNTLKHIDIGNNFMNRTPVAQQLREKSTKNVH